jgi:transcriptional regulator with XRE-family HTH domain
MPDVDLPPTLGDLIREGRVGKKLGLRELARKLDITPSYLSDIENNRRVPSEELLRELAYTLELDFDCLMALAGRFGEQTQSYVKQQPAAGALFRRISERKLGKDALEHLMQEVERLDPPGSTQ